VNFVIFVPHVGQIARNMLRPLTVFSIVVLSSGTCFFCLHLTQNISANEYSLPISNELVLPHCEAIKGFSTELAKEQHFMTNQARID
jgi:hypothetical protein